MAGKGEVVGKDREDEVVFAESGRGALMIAEAWEVMQAGFGGAWGPLREDELMDDDEAEEDEPGALEEQAGRAGDGEQEGAAAASVVPSEGGA